MFVGSFLLLTQAALSAEQNTTIMADQVDAEPAEMVDPLDTLKEKCGQTKECAALMEKLTACNDRVASKSETTETCVEELTDYLHCVDHCLTHNLFKHLK